MILVVDDDSDIAFTLRKGLKRVIQQCKFIALIIRLPDFYDFLLIGINMPWWTVSVGSQIIAEISM
jgi:hypothetical protein